MTKLETIKQILNEYHRLLMAILFSIVVGFLVFFVAKTVGQVDKPKHIIPYVKASP